MLILQRGGITTGQPCHLGCPILMGPGFLFIGLSAITARIGVGESLFLLKKSRQEACFEGENSKPWLE